MKMQRFVFVCSISWLLLVGFFLVLQVSAAPVGPSTAIVVDTLEDEPNSDGNCSLREAITAANTNSIQDACLAGESGVPDTITFSVAGTITLTESLPDIAATGGLLAINAGQVITVSGNNSVQILTVVPGADLTLENIIVAHGYSANGGGGIHNEGTLTITNSTFSGNSDVSWWGGGGIYNEGTLNIANSTFSGNNAENGGGAIVNLGTLTLNNSVFSENRAPDPGGTSALGGGIFNNGNLTITNSAFSENSARGGGGIFAYWDSTLTIIDTTFSANSATMYGGGIHNNSMLSIVNSTFTGNSANESGGGLYNSNWDYGADHIMDITVSITNSTFSGNSAVTGGNLYVDFGSATLYNTILADSPSGSNCAGTISDGGHNIDDGDTCGFGPGSWSNIDPLLVPLGNNGGPTWTHALLVGSPAIDNADPAHCPPTDQRGFPRPVDGNGDGEAICDVGSFELQYPTSTTITADDPDPSFQSQPFTVTFTVTSTYGTPTGEVTVDGGRETCIAPLLDGVGSCTLTLYAAGTYTLTATYAGDGPFFPSSDTEEHIVSPARIFLPIINKD